MAWNFILDTLRKFQPLFEYFGGKIQILLFYIFGKKFNFIFTWELRILPIIYLWKLSNLALGNEIARLLFSIREDRLSCSIFSCATLMVIIFCVRLAFRFFLLINGRLFKNLCRGYSGGPYGLQNNFLEKELGLKRKLIFSTIKCR